MQAAFIRLFFLSWVGFYSLVGLLWAQDSLFLDKLEVIRNQVEYSQWDEALEQALQLKEGYQESLSLRELLFEIYLKKKLFDHSLEELNFLKARRSDEKTRYLEALLRLEQGKASVGHEAAVNIGTSIRLGRELIAENSRFLEARILLCEGLLLLGQSRAAQRHSDYYKGIRGEDRSWFQCEANILLAATPFPQRKIVDLFKSYQERFERDITFFLLEANFYKKLGEYARALKAIDQVLYLNANHLEAIDEKIRLLYYLKDYNALAELLAMRPGVTREEQAERLYTRALIYFLEYKKVLPEKSSVPSVPSVPSVSLAKWELEEGVEANKYLYKPLEKLLELDNENEPVRFFYETLVAANTSFTHPLRKELASYHGRLGTQKLSQGAFKAARVHYLRALSLAPQEISLRKEYSEWLKARGMLWAYGEQLDIIEMLSEAMLAENDAKAEADAQKRGTLLARIEKQTRSDLENRYKITRDEHIREGVQVLVISSLNKEPASTKGAKGSEGNPQQGLFYLQNVFETMLEASLETSFYLEPTFIHPAELEKTLKAKTYDVILTYDFTQSLRTVRLSFTLSSAETRAIIETQTLVASHNERFFKVLLEFKEYLEKKLIRRGRILRIDDNKLIISLGKEQILETAKTVENAEPLATEPQFYVEKKSVRAPTRLLGPFPIKRVEERVSLGEVRDYFLLKEIKLGESVIMRPLDEVLEEK